MISCRTLGSTEVLVDGEPAPSELTWRKHFALLVYLARSPKRRRSREHLIGLLWHDKPESAARHSLNEAIRVIRRSAGEDALVSEAGQVRIVPGVVTLDVDALAQRTAAKDWSGAAALAAGDFLEGFSIAGASEFEDWLDSERQMWRRTSIQALLCHGESLLENGQSGPATDLADRAHQLDPRSEAATGFAMRSLALSGNRDAALELFGQFAARLKEEIGTEPGLELRALTERLRKEPVRQPGAPKAPGRKEARPAPLVAREQELRELMGAWSRCRESGVASLALIRGDAGLGKSRLVEELILRAVLDGASVASARAVESDTSESWVGLRALVRGGMMDFPGVAGAPPESLAAIARQVPEWQERFRCSLDGREVPLAQAFIEVIRVCADERPLLLVLDDAQWVDRESLLSLNALLRDLQNSPVLLVLSAASQPPRVELEAFASGIGRNDRGVLLQLKPLTMDDLTGMARWWLPRFSDEEIQRVTRRVAADSAGLPLLAVELFRAVAQGLDIHQLEAWPQPSRTLDQSLPSELPPSVVAAIRVAFRRLTSGAQQVLAAAAVLPERVSPERLMKATGLEASQVHAVLDELEWNRWLVAEARGYLFVARIVRATVARDLLTEGQRRRILGGEPLKTPSAER